MQAPAVMLLSFVPMFLIASSFYSTPHKLLHLSDRPVLVVPGG